MKINMNIYDNKMNELNYFIHKDYENIEYHMKHILYVKHYLIYINKRLGYQNDLTRLTYIGLGHDLLKEHGLDPKKIVTFNGIDIPQDTNRYVRMNLDVLEEYGLSDFFNTDVQYHALAAGIFMRKELGITDKYILYPVMFHSCPIMDLYKTFPKRLQDLVDMTMLSDKLSSNWLRINMMDKEVLFDLDKAVFGENGKEFNYSLGLYLARIIASGKSDGTQAKITNQYYLEKLKSTNTLIPKNIEFGGKQKWPKRKFPAWKRLLNNSMK